METRAGETEVLEAKLQKQKDRVEKLKEILEEWKVLHRVSSPLSSSE